MDLSRLPAPLIDLARFARTAALRACGPFEWCMRASEEKGLPPLWLRRHTGPVANFSRSARDTAGLISRLSLLAPVSLVLDAGCGAGAVAIELQEALGPAGRYVGFDVHAPSIHWCRKRFRGDPRFRFELADIRTPFSRRSAGSARELRFPASDGSCDFVLAKSLFTHLLAPEAASYLREIGRVLAPKGRALVTAFLFDPEGEVPAFPFSGEAGSIRWKIRNRPHAAVAFSRPAFEAMTSAAGLRIDRTIDGFYPGAARVPSGQDTLILAGAPAPRAGPET
jgi:SAM-dependent methyltransferase